MTDPIIPTGGGQAMENEALLDIFDGGLIVEVASATSDLDTLADQSPPSEAVVASGGGWLSLDGVVSAAHDASANDQTATIVNAGGLTSDAQIAAGGSADSLPGLESSAGEG